MNIGDQPNTLEKVQSLPLGTILKWESTDYYFKTPEGWKNNRKVGDTDLYDDSLIAGCVKACIQLGNGNGAIVYLPEGVK